MSNFRVGDAEHSRLNKMLSRYKTDMYALFGTVIDAHFGESSSSAVLDTAPVDHVTEREMVEAANASLTHYPDTDIEANSDFDEDGFGFMPADSDLGDDSSCGYNMENQTKD